MLQASHVFAHLHFATIYESHVALVLQARRGDSSGEILSNSKKSHSRCLAGNPWNKMTDNLGQYHHRILENEGNSETQYAMGETGCEANLESQGQVDVG